MNIQSLYSVLGAAHLTNHIDAIPSAFSQRGGIMLVAPPEQMKSTMVNVLQVYNDCLCVSDLNVRMFAKCIRDEVASGRYNTIALPAYEKIYMRDASTASNIEATLQAMVEEGFMHASFEDSRSFVRPAKCLVVGALVETIYKRKITEWLDSGFARRFLWCHFKLKDRHAISRSVINWDPIVIDSGLPTFPVNKIAWNVTKQELGEIYALIREGNQPGLSTPHVLSGKIFCVLKWMFRDDKKPSERAMEVFRDFSECLNLRGGAEVDFDKAKTNGTGSTKRD